MSALGHEPARTRGRRFKTFAVGLAIAALAVTGCSRTTATEPSTPAPPPSPSQVAPCTPGRAATPGTTTEKIQVAGNSRSYTLNIPPGYNGSTALPLVMTFHGRGSNATQQLLVTGFDTSSNKNNFILVTPDAIDGNWALPTIAGRATSDTEFVSELLTALGQRLCVDQTRQYASGMSLGSAMTLALACSPTQTFAAFGGVGASFYRPTCNAAPPAPLIYFHGTADPIVPFEGGKIVGSPARSITSRVKSANQNMADWANHNGCASEPTVTQKADVAEIVWSDCKNNSNVDYYRIDDGGHTWPGTNELVAAFTESRLGKTTQTVKATDLMWEFFKQYQLPR